MLWRNWRDRKDEGLLVIFCVEKARCRHISLGTSTDFSLAPDVRVLAEEHVLRVVRKGDASNEKEPD